MAYTANGYYIEDYIVRNKAAWLISGDAVITADSDIITADSDTIDASGGII